MLSSGDGNNNPTKVSFFAPVDAAFPQQAEDNFWSPTLPTSFSGPPGNGSG